MLTFKPKYLLVAAVVGINVAAVTIPFATNAATQTTTLNLSISPVLISDTTSGTVALGPITPTSGGQQSIAKDIVTGVTNDSAGLQISLQENSSSSTALLNGANTIATGSGTPASPAALATNTWGWRMDSLSGFGSGPTSALTSGAPSALTFAGIPANGSPYTLSNTSASGTTTDNVWYSADVDTTPATGTYSTTLLYTFTLN
jgi:hypothetical protein